MVLLVVSLIPDDATVRAGPALAGTSRQRRSAKRAHRVGCGWHRRKLRPERWLPPKADQPNEQDSSRQRRRDPADPTANRKIGVGGNGPERNGQWDEDKQATPHQGALQSGAGMRLLAANAAGPVSPKTDRQKRNPKDVPDIERSNRDRAAWRLAPQAVVIAKRNSLRPETIGTADDEHGNSAKATLPYINPLRCTSNSIRSIVRTQKLQLSELSPGSVIGGFLISE